MQIAAAAPARRHWNELNIGPFYIDFQAGDAAAAREDLNQIEQVRWVLGGLLESSDLRSLWPIRIILQPGAQPIGFVPQHAQNLLIWPPGNKPPLDQIAGILLDDNTPRLPAEVESGLRQLFSTMDAHGSHVTWGGPAAHPDAAWARMQLFATRFEYGASFHIFVKALKSGSSFRAAERNAFSKDPDTLDRETTANLAAAHWEAVPASGRPLDPKRDFGEHAIEDVVADMYLADARFEQDPKAAEDAYKAGVNAGGAAAPLGFERLARVAKGEGADPKPFLNDARRTGSRSPFVFAESAEGLPAAKALDLLKTAAHMNPLWARPIYLQAELAADPKEKETLLKQAAALEPRATSYWVELARLQTEQGESVAAQGTWSRAADSAPTPADREHIEQERDASEQVRLDAGEEARRRDREQVHLEDQRAQQAETDRIKAAEQRANTALDRQAGNEKVGDVVPWDDTVSKKLVQISGKLVSVECSDTYSLVIAAAGNKTTKLAIGEKPKGLSCGTQKPEPRIVAHYHPGPNATVSDYKVW